MTHRASVLCVVVGILASLLTVTPARAQGVCVTCDPGGGGCIIVWANGFYKCTNLGGGACLLERPGCIGPERATVALDGTFFGSATAADGSEAPVGAAKTDRLSVARNVTEREYTRGCRDFIVSRAYSVVVQV